MKLKTLKDIGKENGGIHKDWIYKPEIKEEAIKWVKEDIEDFGIEINTNLPTLEEQLLQGWMRRLNITEDDLK